MSTSRRESAVPGGEIAALQGQGMRVLVADDDPSSRKLLVTVLLKWGYDVSPVTDGRMAWNLAKAEPGPDIVILDWMMPEMTGPEVCARLRRLKREPQPYVILLTAKDRVDDLVEGLDAGADDYLKKPFDIMELKARLRVARRAIELQRELLASRETIRLQSTTDPATGALNRATIVGRLADALPLGAATTALLVAVDDHRMLEERHGLVRTEKALRGVFERIRAMIPGAAIGRYGTDTFLLILRDTLLLDALEGAERLRREVARVPLDLDDEYLSVTVSVGASASDPTIPCTAEWLLYCADTALYSARNGGNRVEVFGLGHSSLRAFGAPSRSSDAS